MFSYLNGKNIVPTPTHCSYSSQSCFKPGNSCINQILSSSYEIYSSFDGELEVRNVFLNISKPFSKMWHDGIIGKLQVVVNRENVNVGVTRGFVLFPLLLLIYNNDLTENLSTNVKISADDTSFFYDIHTSTNNLKKI